MTVLVGVTKDLVQGFNRQEFREAYGACRTIEESIKVLKASYEKAVTDLYTMLNLKELKTLLANLRIVQKEALEIMWENTVSSEVYQELKKVAHGDNELTNFIVKVTSNQVELNPLTAGAVFKSTEEPTLTAVEAIRNPYTRAISKLKAEEAKDLQHVLYIQKNTAETLTERSALHNQRKIITRYVKEFLLEDYYAHPANFYIDEEVMVDRLNDVVADSQSETMENLYKFINDVLTTAYVIRKEGVLNDLMLMYNTCLPDVIEIAESLTEYDVEEVKAFAKTTSDNLEKQHRALMQFELNPDVYSADRDLRWIDLELNYSDMGSPTGYGSGYASEIIYRIKSKLETLTDERAITVYNFYLEKAKALESTLSEYEESEAEGA